MPARAHLKLSTDPKPRGPMRVKFGERSLDAIAPPAKGRLIVYDTDTTGLYLQITANDARAFYLYRKINGRPTRLKLGDRPPMKVSQAITAAHEQINAIARGLNPAQIKREARQAVTFDELFATYIEQHAKRHKRTWEGDQAQFDRHLKQLARRPIRDITRADIVTLHGRVGKEAPIAANRLLALLSKVFAHGVMVGAADANPAKGVKKYREESRDRFIEQHELPAFIAALKAEPDRRLADFVMVALLTGQRRENVSSMAWSEIEIDRALWTIPAEKFKTGKAVAVPLSRPVVEILERRKSEIDPKAKDPRDAYVFPNRSSTSDRLYIAEPKGVMKRLCEQADIAPVRLHDLRRTLASWATMNGTPYPVVARMIGHKVQGVTGVYARFDLEAVRKAFEQTAEAMLGTTTTTEGGNQ
jgi:integrase